MMGKVGCGDGATLTLRMAVTRGNRLRHVPWPGINAKNFPTESGNWRRPNLGVIPFTGEKAESDARVAKEAARSEAARREEYNGTAISARGFPTRSEGSLPDGKQARRFTPRSTAREFTRAGSTGERSLARDNGQRLTPGRLGAKKKRRPEDGASREQTP